MVVDEKWVLHVNKSEKMKNLYQHQNEDYQLKFLEVCWNINGVIHYEFLEHGRIITADTYCQQLNWVNEALH